MLKHEQDLDILRMDSPKRIPRQSGIKADLTDTQVTLFELATQTKDFQLVYPDKSKLVIAYLSGQSDSAYSRSGKIRVELEGGIRRFAAAIGGGYVSELPKMSDWYGNLLENPLWRKVSDEDLRRIMTREVEPKDCLRILDITSLQFEFGKLLFSKDPQGSFYSTLSTAEIGEAFYTTGRGGQPKYSKNGVRGLRYKLVDRLVRAAVCNWDEKRVPVSVEFRDWVLQSTLFGSLDVESWVKFIEHGIVPFNAGEYRPSFVGNNGTDVLDLKGFARKDEGQLTGQKPVKTINSLNDLTEEDLRVTLIKLDEIIASLEARSVSCGYESVVNVSEIARYLRARDRVNNWLRKKEQRRYSQTLAFRLTTSIAAEA